jgi:transposase
MVQEATQAQGGQRFGVVSKVADQLGIGIESLRQWVRQAEIDGGQRGGLTTDEHRRLAELVVRKGIPFRTRAWRSAAPVDR